MLPFVIGLLIGAFVGFGSAAFITVIIEDKRKGRFYE